MSNAFTFQGILSKGQDIYFAYILFSLINRPFDIIGASELIFTPLRVYEAPEYCLSTITSLIPVEGGSLLTSKLPLSSTVNHEYGDLLDERRTGWRLLSPYDWVCIETL